MKKILFHFLYGLQAFRFLQPRDQTVILTYHGFTDKEAHDGIENHQGKHVFVQKFQEQVRFLKKHYNVISLDAWLRNRREGRKNPNRSVIITMDDGYRSNFKLAFPVLKNYGVPATIFLSTGFVEDRKPLWPDRLEYIFDKAENETSLRMELKQALLESREQTVQTLENKLGVKLDFQNQVPDIYQPLEWVEIVKMLESGLVSVGSHTHSHAILTRCTDAELNIELQKSKAIIEERTGESCALFCYPNGGPGDFDVRTKKAVQAAGYECALTTVDGFAAAESDLFEVNRLGVRNQTYPAEFAMTLCGFKKALSDAKTFFRKA